MPKIVVNQKKLSLDAPLGANLMTFLQSCGLPVASSCLGDGICGKCRMKITGSTSPMSNLEKETLARNNAASGERLACQILIETELSIETTYW